MIEQLSIVKAHLESRYKDLLSHETWAFERVPSFPIREPIWLSQDATFKLKSPTEATGALILDPHIGLCLYIQAFTPDTLIDSQISRALELRSELLPTKKKDEIMDDTGSWRVVLHWLVEAENLDDWIRQAADLREKTAYFEEISIDVIVNSDKNWSKAIEKHAFPRLLIETRKIFSKPDYASVKTWQSADIAVSKALTGLEDSFKDEMERLCALEIDKKVTHKKTEQESETAKALSTIAHDLLNVSVEGFRNLNRLTINFRDVGNAVSSTVIHGPNGSGKSSVFEAISLAIAGTSFRHVNYLKDQNRGIVEGRDYAQNYLTNIAQRQAVAKFSLNGSSLNLSNLPILEEANSRLKNLSTNFLSQETSDLLVSQSSSELGAEIASSLSAMADSVRELIEYNLSMTTAKQKEFNTRWGLRTTVTKRETVIEQVSTRILDGKLPNYLNIISWLKLPILKEFSFGVEVNEVIRTWDSLAQQKTVLATALSKCSNTEEIAASLKGYVEDLATAIRKSSSLLKGIKSLTEKWPQDFSHKVFSFSTWLQNQSISSSTKDSEEVRVLKEEERKIISHQESLTNEGKDIAERLKYFEASALFLNDWSKKHDAACITCDTDLTHRNGLALVTTALKNELQTKVTDLREKFRKSKLELEAISAKLSLLGAASPPLNVEDRIDLTRGISLLLPHEGTIEELLLDKSVVEKIIQFTSEIRTMPTPPENLNLDVQVLCNTIADEISSISLEHEKVSRLPEAWKAIKKEVVNRLDQVTQQHLPKTIQSLWLEIAKNMMPAPWQYPGDLGIHNAVKRGAPEAAITIKGSNNSPVLANYILNGAEVHNLGVAWFFTKFITEGRFKYSFLVLDDPAQSMDQPTYRDFCRFLETLLRIYKKNSKPLSLVLLLHQDQRALDAARATNGVLYSLRWNKFTPPLLRSRYMYGEQISFPLPLKAIQG